MLTLMLTASTTISIMFTTMKHPLSAGMMLLLQTIMISMMTGNMNHNFWFSYMLFLIMIGGMLILFMYMTSIASNEKFKPNIKMLMLFTVVTPTIWTIHPTAKTMIKNNELINTNEQMSIELSLNKYINMPLSMTFMFMMVYLFLALIATVKITSFKQGSIRQMN